MLAPAAVAKTIAGLVDAAALRTPSKLALLATGVSSSLPNSNTNTRSFTYEELSHVTNSLAGFLSLYGYENKDVLVCDLPNTAENLLVQLACNRIGVTYGTTKNVETMAGQFTKIKGAIVLDDHGTTHTTSKKSFLSDINLPLPYLSNDFLMDLIYNGGLKDYNYEQFDDDDEQDRPHAYYNTSIPYTNQQALEHGRQSAWELAMSADDIVCVAVTLCHPFGMGSAICSTLQVGGTIALPCVDGIYGCGVPSDRAVATVDTLKQQACTLLFADTHTMKALPVQQPHDLPNFRGGVCKTGSGSDFLIHTTPVTFAGVSLRAMGKKE